MDAYDYMEFDKAMSKRLNAIFDDPKRHAFESCFDFHRASNTRGPRGGMIFKRSRKTICYWCGCPEKGHAEKTEQL